MAGGFWNLAREAPGRLALVDPGGREVAAGELLAEANRLARGLRAAGLGRGDVVAAVLPNGVEVFELYLAVMQTGLYLTPVNVHLTAPEIAYILADSEAKVFVGHERFADACSAAAKEAGVPEGLRFAVGELGGFRPYAELKAGQPADPPDQRAVGSVMNYTSGTTGRPKGVKRPLMEIDPDTASELFGMFLQLFGVQPDADNVHLVGSPLYHTAVLQFATMSLHLGHTVVVMDRWTPEGMLQLVERHRVTTSHMVPTQFHRLLALPEEVKGRYDVSSLRHVIHSAAPCPVEIKRRMLQWWGPVIYEYYAATEGGGTLVTPQEWLERPGTVGKAWPMSQVEVRDDEGNPLPPREVGTVWMSMGEYTFEYHKDREKTERTWRGKWFTVGDAGYLDEDGYLFLVDRKTDMIISGGVNIYPAEIEAVLLTHPKVGDAAVFGIPNEDWGEEVKAVVQPADGVEPTPALAEELLAWCRERLAKFKVPRSVDFMAELPRDPNGKLYKRKLRDPYWEGRERKI